MPSSTDRRTPLLVLAVAGVLILFSLAVFYNSDGAVKTRAREARLAEAAAAGGAEAGQAPRPIAEIEVFQVQREAAAEWLELSGLLEPVRSTWVAAEITGRITEIAAVEHDTISAGALLVRLDPALPDAELIRAEANHHLAELELARQETLGQRSVASAADRDRAGAEERSRYAALLEARERVEQTRIRAPFAGVVNALELDPGAFVAPGTRVAEVLDVATLEIEVEVSDRQIGALRQGDEVRVRIDPLGNEVRTGIVARVARAPHPESQRYPVVVALENAEGQMLPGMLARVELEVGRSKSIRLPVRAIVREFELDYVFVVRRDEAGGGQVERARVKTRPVPFRPDWVEILEGIAPADWIAVTDAGRLEQGQTVRIRKASSR